MTSATSFSHKGSMLVVKLASNTFRTGLRHELHFAYQPPAPGLVDARAEFRLHTFKLLAPAFAVGGNLDTAIVALDRPRMRSERLADDGGPRAGKPGERGLGPVHFAHNSPQDFARAVH